MAISTDYFGNWLATDTLLWVSALPPDADLWCGLFHGYAAGECADLLPSGVTGNESIVRAEGLREWISTGH